MRGGLLGAGHDDFHRAVGLTGEPVGHQRKQQLRLGLSVTMHPPAQQEADGDNGADRKCDDGREGAMRKCPRHVRCVAGRMTSPAQCQSNVHARQ